MEEIQSPYQEKYKGALPPALKKAILDASLMQAFIDGMSEKNQRGRFWCVFPQEVDFDLLKKETLAKAFWLESAKQFGQFVGINRVTMTPDRVVQLVYHFYKNPGFSFEIGVAHGISLYLVSPIDYFQQRIVFFSCSTGKIEIPLPTNNPVL